MSITIEELRSVKDLADLTEGDLQWLVDHSEEQCFPQGEVVVHEGDPADAMIILLSGEMEGRHEDRAVYNAGAGEISGKLPYSRMVKYPRTMRAVADLRIASVPESSFPEMLDAIPKLEVKLIRLMLDRIRETTALDQQQSKLAALGKLSAGLAHELNNPAAAAARAAGSIGEKLSELMEIDRTLAESKLTPEQRVAINDVEARALEHARGCSALDTLTRSDREEELGTRLSKLGIPNAWDLAPELIDAGFTATLLDTIAQASSGSLPQVLSRIATLIALQQLTNEVRDSMGRISDLVKSIKEYSYMDTAAEREVDLHNDLENTLRILAAKINKSGVTIERAYDKALPLVCANGSELNQVWTNLIDNAVDAMKDMESGSKVLRVRTALKLDRVMVEIFDTGPGIPEAIQQKIFEPFFTTKKQGEGTGLGLDLVQRIVRRHKGDIRLQSAPGKTCFQIMLPIKGRNGAAAQ